MIRQPGGSIKERDYFRMCQVNQQCRTTIFPKVVATDNQQCPEKQMAMYVTPSLIATLQEHVCDRNTTQSLVNISNEQSCWKAGHSVKSMYQQ